MTSSNIPKSLNATELRSLLEGMDEHAKYMELTKREERGEMIPKQWQLYMYYYESLRLGTPEDKMTRIIPERWLERDEKRRGGCSNILPFDKKTLTR